MDQILRRKQSFLLRLPPTLREAAAQKAHEEGISLNHFIGLALAEKLSRLEVNQALLRGRPVGVFHPRADLRRA